MPGITKRALAQSLKELMERRSFAAISVTEITEHCGLNRKSFYYHFEDKYALLEWVFRSELDTGRKLEAGQDFWAVLEQMLCYLEENRPFYRSAAGADGLLREVLARELERCLLSCLDDRLGLDASRKKARSQFLADAFALSIEKWLDTSPPLTPAQYISLFRVHSEVGS